MRCKICDKQTTKKCSHCRVVCYCDRQCQRQDWSAHKPQCVAWKTNILDWITQNKDHHVLIIGLTDGQQRKLVHQCIEYATNTYSRSLKLPCFPFGPKRRFYKQCYECNRKNIPFGIENYCEGVMDSNMDESYRIVCPNCHTPWHWECNYDGYDQIISVNTNNCVVIGDAMKYFKLLKSKLDESSCPCLPCVSVYNTVKYHILPTGLRGMKNLIQTLNSSL